MSRPRLLDLYCGAGGAAMGYYRAGFEVVGVDIKPQPRYPFEFHQADALEYCAAHGHEYDAIHASPPCQAYSALRSLHATREYDGLIPATRLTLQTTGKLWVIENVARAAAYLHNPIMLCGTMFNLGTGGAELQRHRLFETHGIFVLTPRCNHQASRVITVVGHTGGRSTRQATNGFDRLQRNEAMGIDWMTQAELSQAIPPAYTEYIGAHLVRALEASL